MARGPGPFELHLREAIALNRLRAPRYAALSDGASLPISRALIRQERMLLPLARWFDRRAEPYHRAGVPLLLDAFVSMDHTPEWLPDCPRPAAAPRLRPRAWPMAWRLGRTLRREGLEGFCTAVEAELAALDAEPAYHAMLRHLLESAARIARLAPHHHRAARNRGLTGALRISTQLLRLHLLGLPPAARLDRRAAPLQARGIAILARDVPPIPRR